MITPKRGAEPFDICPGPCEHSECLDMLALAAEPCGLCGQPLGEGVEYLTDYPTPGGLKRVHGVCAGCAA